MTKHPFQAKSDSKVQAPAGTGAKSCQAPGAIRDRWAESPVVAVNDPGGRPSQSGET